MTEQSGKLRVFPILRDCRGCAFVRRDTGTPRSDYLCSLCASLVRDEDGRRFVYLRAIEDGARGFMADPADLTPPPRALR